MKVTSNFGMSRGGGGGGRYEFEELIASPARPLQAEQCFTLFFPLKLGGTKMDSEIAIYSSMAAV